MGYFSLYDYTSVFRKNLNAALVNQNDLTGIQPGTYNYNGNAFTLTKTAGNSPAINLECLTAAFDDSELPDILNSIGIRTQSLLSSVVPMDDFHLGFDENRQAPPDYLQTYNSNTHSATFTFNVPTGFTGYTFSYYESDKGMAIPLAMEISENEVALGVLSFASFNYVGSQRTAIVIRYYPTLTTDNWSESSGEKGFRPTGAYTNKDNPGVGGRGTSNKKDPDYAGDPISLPGAPDESVASAVGCGFINCYKVDTANLEKVGQCLYGSTLLGLIQSISVNPLDFIISLMIFPCSPNVGASEHIKLGGWVAAAAGGAALGFDASGQKLSTQFKTVPFGSVSIPENWGNFLDYSQTNIELYLPFVGSVSIDVSECMGGTIEVEYTIDFFTGMCVANVLCTRPNYVLPSGKALTNVHAEHAYQGNCAIQIPLSAVNYGSMVGSLINACTQGITNPVAGFTGIMTDAVSGGLRPNVSSKGNIVANSGFCSVLYPYVRITRPITAEPESYQEVMGLPSYINTSLGQCEGLCVCDDIDLRSISGATENELNKIRQMCKDGVYV